MHLGDENDEELDTVIGAIEACQQKYDEVLNNDVIPSFN